MKFGVGTSIKNAEIVAAAGFDYLEIFAADNLALSIPEETWRENLRRIKDAPLPVLAMAAILPATVQLVGDGVDMAANVSYMERLLDRAAAAGMKTLVFGSNKSRTIPEGFDHAVAARQLEDYLQAIVGLAEDRGVQFVIEPLHAECTNTFTTIAASAAMVRKINRPGMALLVDFYHFHKTDHDVLSLCWNADLLRHSHVSGKSREIPGTVDCDYVPFMRILRQAGYDHSMSIEATFPITADNAKAAQETLRQAWAAAAS